MPHPMTSQPPRLKREYVSSSASTSSNIGSTGKSNQCASRGMDADESNFATTDQVVETATSKSGSVLITAAKKKSFLSKADWTALFATLGILVIPQIFKVSDSALVLIVFIQFIFTVAYAVVVFRRFRDW